MVTELKKNKVILLITALVSWPTYSFVYSQDPDSALAGIKELDCKKDVGDCRYYSSVEIASYFDSCPSALGDRLKNFDKTTERELNNLYQGMLKDWLLSDSVVLADSVLHQENKLRHHLSSYTKEYLAGLPTKKIISECNKVARAVNGEPAENMSELLRTTKNYNKWIYSFKKNMVKG